MNPVPRLIVCLLVGSATVQAAPDYGAEGEAWWSCVKVLADDSMEGRNTGSAGYQRAAAYVASQFEEIGLRPAGNQGFYQPMKFDVRQIIEDRSSLELVRNGQAESLNLGDDANLAVPADMAEHIEAPCAFVGYGLVIPEAGVDDLAGLDLKGKIAVTLSGGPKSIPGPIKAHYSAARQQWQALRRAGAVGVARVGNPRSSDIPWARSTLARFRLR